MKGNNSVLEYKLLFEYSVVFYCKHLRFCFKTKTIMIHLILMSCCFDSYFIVKHIYLNLKVSALLMFMLNVCYALIYLLYYVLKYFICMYC